MCRGPKSVESQKVFEQNLGMHRLGGTLSPIEKAVISQFLEKNPPRVTPRPGIENPVLATSKSRRPLFGLTGLAGRFRS
jgi:hypothetical protein